MAAATVLACPFRTAMAFSATQVSAWGSPSAWKLHAARHRYSRTWMKSMRIGSVTRRAFASAWRRSIWWLLPSTSATQVREWVGSRRSASAKSADRTCAASSTTLAVSHLFVARAPAPRATNKWLTASVVDDAAHVLSALFAEAERRDPTHSRTWVALVDGNNHQIDRLHAEAKARRVTLPILIDFIHVLEYLWRAAWSFHAEGDPHAETWVAEKAMAVLNGHASTVAAAIRRKATCRGLPAAQRANADRCADY